MPRPGQSQDDSVLTSTSRTGRHTARVSPSPRQASSLPRPARPPTPPPPETQRPVTPLVLQRDQSRRSLQHQLTVDNRSGKTWTKSEFVSKLRQISTAKNTNERKTLPENPAGSQSATPGLHLNPNSLVPPQTLTTDSQGSEDSKNVIKTVIRTFSPSKGLMTVVSGKTHPRFLTPTAKEPPTDQSAQSLRRCCSHGDRKQHLELPLHPASLQVSGLQPSGTDEDSESGEWRVENSYLFTPPPLSPAQEAVLYQSLEQEILSNLQQLGMDSDASDSEKDQSSPHPATPGPSPEISSEVHNPSVSCSKPEEKRKARPEVLDYEVSNGHTLFEETSLEIWVNAVPGGFRDRMQKITSNSDSKHLSVCRPSEAGSCSSLGPSLDSKDLVEPSKTPEAENIVETDETPNKSSSPVAYKHEKLRVSSFRQKRSLKKPERVPSIYKLKLRPFVRPRRDHRPDRKPSRIPKPIPYRRSPSSGDAAHRSVSQDGACLGLKGRGPPRGASRNPQSPRSRPPAEQDPESWV